MEITPLEHRPVAITGMHRSGTSMVTRILHDSGLHLLGPGADAFIDAADDNPEGFWENAAIVACNDDLLEATGGAWDNPPALPPQGLDDPRVVHVGDSAKAALAALREHIPWGFKDPRTCLTAAYWMDLEPELVFVICVRHPLETALSLKRRNQNSYSLGVDLWERYYATLLETVPRERRIVTHYNAFFNDPSGEMERLCEFAGLVPAEPHVRGDLRHHEIDVTLGDAGVSPSLVALYDDLCREAGVQPPTESTVDEGRVRRLILDGAVARKHAEQRQQAIDRLEARLKEREQQLQTDRATLEANLRARVRDLEGQLAAVKQMSHAISEIDRRTRHTEARVEIAVQAVKPGRGRRALRRWTKRALGLGRARVVKPGRRIAGRGKRAVMPHAKSVAGQLPEPAQHVLRRGRRVWARSRKKVVTRMPAAIKRSLAPPSVPRGPASKEWKKHYEQLVATTVPAGTPWIVASPGSPRSVRDAGPRAATEFPRSPANKAAGAGQACIAQLEALRYQGHARLVVPAPSRQWFQQQVELREHVTGRYRSLADHDGGVAFDLEHRTEAGPGSLLTEITRLGAALGEVPAVLDWTEFDVADELPGFTTFRPPDGSRLPYLDASVAIVVVDGLHDRGEAARVASVAVIVVERDAGGSIVARSVDVATELNAPSMPRTLVISAGPTENEQWFARMSEAANEAGAQNQIGPVDADTIGTARHDFDVIVVLEANVLPLPSAIEAAAALAAADPTAAVAAKIIRADGRLESVGATVFADRSVGLIAHGSDDVGGPWHEYVRPVCWAPGLVAASTELWKAVEPPAHLSGRAGIREWCSDVWQSGRRVIYQPTVVAIRVSGDGSEPTIPLTDSSWQRVLDLRPRRPGDLSDGAWRYLLAHDDVEACRG